MRASELIKRLQEISKDEDYVVMANGMPIDNVYFNAVWDRIDDKIIETYVNIESIQHYKTTEKCDETIFR